METNKLLSALSYFSVLFAGILFPLVVYFVSDNSTVKSHAKKALLSHLVPLIPLPLIGIGIFMDITGDGGMGIPIFMTMGIVLSILFSFIVLIWNIVKGVKVLKNE
jgi:hypothetical protein